MHKVAITGTTGFIGSHLVTEMINNNVDVYAFVRKAPLNKRSDCASDGHGHLHVIEYNSDEYNALIGRDNGIDVFYHLAWGGVAAQDKNDTELQIENISMSVKMLDYAKAIGAHRFIGIGTVAEYAFCEGIMDLNARQTPGDMYGAAKTATHYLLEARARLINMPFIWAVVPSTYGEGRNNDNILTYTITSLLRNEKPSYGHLNQMWDFLYVAEVARALRYVGGGGHTGKTYGIGSGVYKSLKEYVTSIRDMINPSMELGIGDRPELSDKTFSSCVSIEELTMDTGFMPQISFEEGIRKTIEWYRDELFNKENDVKNN